MSKVYIGIDPGASGAVAFIYPDQSINIRDFDDGDALMLIRSIAPTCCMVILEKVSAMPKQGVSSTFKFGQNFGQWIGRLEALHIPFDFVTPQKWKKVMFDSMPKGDVKAMSLDRARRLFPHMAEQLKRKKDHSRAEALLLAEFARRTDR